MALSTQRLVSDGVSGTVAVSIRYLDPEDILVTVDGVQQTRGVDYYWLDANTFYWQIQPPPNGAEIIISRNTQLEPVLHEFNLGAAFTEASMDENFLQMLYLLQEARENTRVSDLFSDLNMNGQRITGLGDPQNASDAVNLRTLDGYRQDLTGPVQEALMYRNQAAASATASAASATNAAGVLNSLRNIYYGASSTAPTQRPDGSARMLGDLYFNTAASSLMVWNGAMWSSLGGGSTPLVRDANLSDLQNVATARSNLGLGTLATASAVGYAELMSSISLGTLAAGKSLRLRTGTSAQHASYYGTAGELTYDSTLQRIRLMTGSTPGGIILGRDLPDNLNTLRTVTSTALGAQLVSASDPAAARSFLGLGALATQSFVDVTSLGLPDVVNTMLMSMTAQEVRQSIGAISADDLPSEVTQAEAEAGVEDDMRLWSPERVAQAIAALATPAGNENPAAVTQAEAEEGTLDEARTFTPLAVAQAIAALAPGGGTSGEDNPPEATPQEAAEGTETGLRSWSPDLIRQAIEALSAGGQTMQPVGSYINIASAEELLDYEGMTLLRSGSFRTPAEYPEYPVGVLGMTPAAIWERQADASPSIGESSNPRVVACAGKLFVLASGGQIYELVQSGQNYVWTQRALLGANGGSMLSDGVSTILATSLGSITTLLRSGDGGSTWQSVNHGLGGSPVYALGYNNLTNVWLCGNVSTSPSVRQSADGGLTWQAAPGISYGTGTNGYTHFGRVGDYWMMRTWNSGTAREASQPLNSWGSTTITVGGNSAWSGLFTSEAGTGILVSSTVLAVSTNAMEWQQCQLNDLPSSGWNHAAAGPGGVWIITGTGGIGISIDDGRTFNPVFQDTLSTRWNSVGWSSLGWLVLANNFGIMSQDAIGIRRSEEGLYLRIA